MESTPRKDCKWYAFEVSHEDELEGGSQEVWRYARNPEEGSDLIKENNEQFDGKIITFLREVEGVPDQEFVDAEGEAIGVVEHCEVHFPVNQSADGKTPPKLILKVEQIDVRETEVPEVLRKRFKEVGMDAQRDAQEKER